MNARLAMWALCALSGACTCVGAVSDDELPRPVSGTVLRAISLCETLPGATVRLLDGTRTATTDAEGRFTVETTGRGALHVTGPGLVDGLTFIRRLERGSDTELAAAIPVEEFGFFYGLAGFEPNPELGSVVAIVADEAPLPVTGAVVRLLLESGEEAPANARRRVVTLADNAPAFEVGPETALTGTTMFFNVSPGLYRLSVERGGAVIGTATVPVRKGSASVDFVRVSGTIGTPVPFSGVVRAAPTFPNTGAVAPLAGAQVTLSLDGTPGESTTTGADGRYQLLLPKLGSWFDVTVTAPGRPATRSRSLCSGLATGYQFTLDGAFELDSELMRHRRGRLPVPDAGTLVTSVRRAGAPLAGAVLTLEPPVETASYQSDVAVRPMCPRGSCASGEACPAGTRCEGGECLVGQTPLALCRACGSTPCATGYGQVEMPEPDGGFGCRCIPNFDSCTRAVPRCEPGTYCATFLSFDAGVASLVGTACAVAGPPASATQVQGGRSVAAFFLDVPAGRYVVTAAVDGGFVGRARVRVSEGVVSSFVLP